MSSAYYNQKVLFRKPDPHLSRSRSDPSNRRLVVVSNRLPVKFDKDGQARISSGGLVTAMVPVLNRRGGLWIGWPGTSGDMRQELDRFALERPYRLEPVALLADDVDGYYTGFANQVLWPLFHGFQTRCVFDGRFWEAYDRVNRIFARGVAENTQESDYVWIHDYHLINVAQKLKQTGVSRECGFYLHIPFPPPDLFLRLPWRQEILDGFLENDLVGFQTEWDLDNFLRTVRIMSPDAGLSWSGPMARIKKGRNTTRAGAFPISIDFDEFSRQAAEAEPSCLSLHPGPEHQTILGVDRLDYSKGIPERLKAFARVLQEHPRTRERLSLVQIVVPSRESVAEYRSLKKEIERLVGEINGEFATLDWTPVQYLYRSLPREELVATYQQADIALITPLRDGMNLVAKEYCACKNGLDGVLILSEFAGAAPQLRAEALLVNPCDVAGMAQTIIQAWEMPTEERQKRMEAARQKIEARDITWWLNSFLEAALQGGGRRLAEPGRPGSRPTRSGLSLKNALPV